MRRPCIFGALLVVLVANGWGVWQAVRNRAEQLGGTLQLTERELRLEPVAFESSVTVLRLQWRTDSTRDRRFGPAVWLDSAKLAGLGFDCGVAADSPKAARHYASTPPRRVFLALEYQNDTAPGAAAQDKGKTGLMVIDANQNAERLRERYPDPAKHSICRGIVRIALTRRDADGVLLGTPRLEGWVVGLLPSQVSVPRPANRLLAGLLRPFEESAKSSAGEPRFSARIRWGKNYEPWVDDIRALGRSPQ